MPRCCIFPPATWSGERDGRVSEELQPNYTPLGVADFDAEREWQSLQELVRKPRTARESPEIEAALRRQALGEAARAKSLRAGTRKPDSQESRSAGCATA